MSSNTHAITFRAARSGDLPIIVAMLADDALGSQRECADLPLDPGYLAAFEAITADPNQLLAVAEDGATVVGTLQLTFLPGLSYRGAWVGQIEGVRIASDRRGSGLGKQMIEWALAQCRARGCQSVQLSTNKARVDAQRFYRQLGFTHSHEAYKIRF